VRLYHWALSGTMGSVVRKKWAQGGNNILVSLSFTFFELAKNEEGGLE